MTDLQAHEAVAVVMTGYDTSGPISIKTLPPAKPTGITYQVRTLSREKYGRPNADVMRQMEARYQIKPKSDKLPPISGADLDWG